MTTSPLSLQGPLFSRSQLQQQLAAVATGCHRCGICVRECPFLTGYGDPKTLADTYDPGNIEDLTRAFECNLCALCTAVCPDQVDPAAMFLEMRREAVRQGTTDLVEHRGLRKYEKTGTSRRFSWYALPEGCDTIFFPGCALSGTRANITWQTYDHLRTAIPALGIVLDCCNSPSHNLGDTDYFSRMFGEMRDYLVAHQIRQVLVACPNCAGIFREYGGPLTTRTVYEVLAEQPQPATTSLAATVTVHDSCVSRFDRPVRQAVRQILVARDVRIEEMPHSHELTLCCGEGGGARCLAPEQARRWINRRLDEAGSLPIISYCAGCTSSYGTSTTSAHVLDLVFAPQAALTGANKVAKAPFTYLDRLRLKKRLQRKVPAAVTRERTFRADGTKSGRALLLKVGCFALLVGLLLAAHKGHVGAYLEQAKLHAFLQQYGVLAPLLYMLLYTLAPALFLPGLPITIVGGILFGPFWGVLYTITSATAGACLAFLISRYLARDLVKNRLYRVRWRQLDRQVEQHGWKMVALTRLIPLFPFNLLNYAFGLTSVKFHHYALASFIFMLPGCVAFIVFSSSLLDLLQGNISPTFLIGVVLVVGVSLIPMAYHRVKQRQQRTLRKAPADHRGNPTPNSQPQGGLNP